VGVVVKRRGGGVLSLSLFDLYLHVDYTSIYISIQSLFSGELDLQSLSLSLISISISIISGDSRTCTRSGVKGALQLLIDRYG